MLTRRTFHTLFAAAFPAGLSADGDLEKYYALRNANDPDVSAEARSSIARELRFEFKEFLETASGFELYFLREVMNRYSATSRPVGAELAIATAFQDALDRGGEFIEVPARFAEQTAEFVAGLVDAARAEGG